MDDAYRNTHGHLTLNDDAYIHLSRNVQYFLSDFALQKPSCTVTSLDDVPFICSLFVFHFYLLVRCFQSSPLVYSYPKCSPALK